MNYSLLVMESAGMMKMATGDGFPLRQGAGMGSREVFGGYRGLRRRNSRSIVFLDVFRVYGHICAKEVGQGSLEGPTRVEGAPRGVGTPPCLMASSLLPLCGLQVSRIAFLPKISSMMFQVNWTPFDIPFLRNTKIGKKTTIWAGPPVNRLVPKII